MQLEIFEKERGREREMMKDTIEDLLEVRNRWRQQATALIEHKTELSNGFWKRFFKK